MIEIPSQSAVIKRYKTNLKTNLPKSDPFLRNSVLGAFSIATPSSIYEMYQVLQEVETNIRPDTATGTYAEAWAKNLGTTRNQSTQSSGSVAFTGTIGSKIPQGTILLSQSGDKYYTINQSVISTISIAVTLKYIAGVVTATSIEQHNLATGMNVIISGATHTEYNILTSIVVINSYIFQYTIVTHPSSDTDKGTSTSTFANAIIKSYEFGYLQNLVAGTVLNVSDIITGIDSNTYVCADGITGGEDTESDDSLRNRYIDVLSMLIGFASNKYWYTKCMGINGVTNAWVFDEKPRIGCFTVYIMIDNKIPTPTQVNEIRNIILLDKPSDMASTGVIVKAPTPITIDFEFSTLNPNTSDMQVAIINNLQNMFTEQINVGVNIPESAYKSCIYNTIDSKGNRVISCVLVKPVGDIKVAEGEIGMLGTIRFG